MTSPIDTPSAGWHRPSRRSSSPHPKKRKQHAQPSSSHTDSEAEITYEDLPEFDAAQRLWSDDDDDDDEAQTDTETETIEGEGPAAHSSSALRPSSPTLGDTAETAVESARMKERERRSLDGHALVLATAAPASALSPAPQPYPHPHPHPHPHLKPQLVAVKSTRPVAVSIPASIPVSALSLIPTTTTTTTTTTLAHEIANAKSGTFLARHPEEGWSLLFRGEGSRELPLRLRGKPVGEVEVPLRGKPEENGEGKGAGGGWMGCAERDGRGRMARGM